MSKQKHGPRVLTVDIETSPLLCHVWSLWQTQNIAVGQLKADWFVLAWAAKWLGSSSMIYRDQRSAKNLEDDSAILKELWALLDEADIVVGQNVKSFDLRKINARFAIHGLKPPSPYRVIDTKELAKKNFDFTSAGLEYLSEKLCKRYKKLKHKKFPGFELWKECLRGNPAAWREMERYNRFDVLATEELYEHLAPWGSGIDFNAYRDGEISCNCGSHNLQRRGFGYTKTGKYQQFVCNDCGAWMRATGEKNNLLTPEQRKLIRKVR